MVLWSSSKSFYNIYLYTKAFLNNFLIRIYSTTFAASQDPYWVKEEANQTLRVIRSSDEVTTESTLLPDQSTTTVSFPSLIIPK